MTQNIITGSGAGSGNSPRPYLIQMRVSVKILARIVHAWGPNRFVFLKKDEVLHASVQLIRKSWLYLLVHQVLIRLSCGR